MIQAAVWILTDNADYQDLGTLVDGFTHQRQISQTDAARAIWPSRPAQDGSAFGLEKPAGQTYRGEFRIAAGRYAHALVSEKEGVLFSAGVLGGSQTVR